MPLLLCTDSTCQDMRTVATPTCGTGMHISPQRRAIANIYAVLTTDSCTGSSSQLKTLTPQALLSTNGLSRYILVSNECVSYVSQDLIAAQKNRANVNWIIFVTHRPMYCSDLDELNQHEVGADIRYIRTVRPPPLPPFFSS